MKLRKVRLQNIKSYVDQEINFNEGVNFISGINGAGKSTIIEAIGYALFNYNSGTINEFLRYGTKTGTITIEFCALDEREYRVVRKLGTSSLWAVFDLETGGELDLHGTKDVVYWLKEAFGIDQDMDLGQLFRDIVGVSQGTFVAPFLETPSVRKKKFDSILKVEQYREAFFNTRGVVGTLKDSLRDKEKDLAVLNSEVSDYDSLKEQVATLKGKVKELEQQQKIVHGQIKKKSTRVEELENLKKELEEANTKLQALSVAIESLTGRQKDLQENLEQAIKAGNILKQAEDGYKSYLSLDKEMQRLEVEKQKKEKLEKELYKLQQEAAALEGLIKAKNEELVERQGNLHKEQQDSDSKLKDVTTTLEKLKANYQELLKNQDEISLWQNGEDKLQKIYTELQEIYREIAGKQEFITGTLEKEEAEIEERLKVLPEIEKKAAGLEIKEKDLTSAREQWARIKERLNSLQNDQEQASDGLCPFLKSPCQNVGGDLKGYFSEQIEAAKKEMIFLQEQGTKLAAEVKEAKEAREKLISLKSESERLQKLRKQKKALSDEINTLLNKGRSFTLKEFLSKLTEKAQKPLEIEDCLDLWNKPWNGQDELDNLLAALEKVLEQSKSERTEIEKSLTGEINQLSNEITRYSTEHKNILAALKQLKLQEKQIETEKEAIERNREKFNRLQGVINETSSQLTGFEQIDPQIKDTKEKLQKFRKDYETYMQNKAEASKKDSLEQQLDKLVAKIKEKKALVGQLEAQKGKLAGQFDQQVYDTERKELDRLKETFFTQKQYLQERKEDLKETSKKLDILNKKLLEMEKLEQEMNESQKTLKLLDLIRGILSNAGAPIAKVYLENLSREANEIYRQISLDNSLLEWRPDYDITLTDNFQGNERLRSFKQFSGGEQMTAALSVRLALLKQQSLIRVGFFDEPTANLDSERRMNLAETVPRVTGDFDQLFIISHDDTFDSMTDNVIQVKKDLADGSVLE